MRRFLTSSECQQFCNLAHRSPAQEAALQDALISAIADHRGYWTWDTVIVANSGMLLDDGVNAVYTGAEFDDPNLNTGIIGAEFGWTAIELKQDRATVTTYRLDCTSFFRMSVPASA